MISLQIAFLIAGVVIFIIVAIISYDKIRHTRLYGRKGSGSGSGAGVEDYTDVDIGAEEPEPMLTPRRSATGEASRFEAYDEDDIPESPSAEHSRFKPEFLDQERAAGPEKDASDWDEQLRDAEEVANTPIDGVPEMREYTADESIQIEYVARIPGKNVIKRDSALGIYRQREFEMSKPHRIFGLSHPTRMWCDLEKQPESARFTDFGLTLQLADRQGPIDEGELNRFSQVVLKLSEVFGRRFQFSCDMDEALNQAEFLDKLVRKYDALAILNIVARNEPFKLSQVDEAARALGMTPNQKNVYIKHEGDRPVYRMADMEKTDRDAHQADSDRATRGITMFMDIPRTLDPARVFNDMVNDAKELCKVLDGKLVDDNHRGMTQKGLKRIGQEIRTMAAEMERDGVAPGRDCAMKLF